MFPAYSLKKFSHIDRMVIPWKSGSSHLVSLLDMINLGAKDFCDFMRELDGLFSLFNSERPNLTNREVKQIQEVVEKISKWCKLMELDAAPRFLKDIEFRVNYDFIWATDPTSEGLGDEMWRLRRLIEDELDERFLLYIPRNDVDWYEQENSFGDRVSKAFPSAKDDIKEAGTCLATGRYTACVFHLMRALEYALKALAKDVELSFGKRTWGKIISMIERKIKDLYETNPQTYAEIERLQFLSQAATDFGYFKNSWRDHVAHLRYTCKDRLEAVLILNHVKSFMNHLSKKLSE